MPRLRRACGRRGRRAQELADYADFLGAQASHEAGDEAAAEALLRGFTDRYPDSIFDAEAPELEANVLLAMGNAAGAQRVLAQAKGLAAAGPHRLSACAGAGGVRAGPDAERRTRLQATAAGPSIEPRMRRWRAPG